MYTYFYKRFFSIVHHPDDLSNRGYEGPMTQKENPIKTEINDLKCTLNIPNPTRIITSIKDLPKEANQIELTTEKLALLEEYGLQVELTTQWLSKENQYYYSLNLIPKYNFSITPYADNSRGGEGKLSPYENLYLQSHETQIGTIQQGDETFLKLDSGANHILIRKTDREPHRVILTPENIPERSKTFGIKREMLELLQKYELVAEFTPEWKSPGSANPRMGAGGNDGITIRNKNENKTVQYELENGTTFESTGLLHLGSNIFNIPNNPDLIIEERKKNGTTFLYVQNGEEKLWIPPQKDTFSQIIKNAGGVNAYYEQEEDRQAETLTKQNEAGIQQRVAEEAMKDTADRTIRWANDQVNSQNTNN